MIKIYTTNTSNRTKTFKDVYSMGFYDFIKRNAAKITNIINESDDTIHLEDLTLENVTLEGRFLIVRSNLTNCRLTNARIFTLYNSVLKSCSFRILNLLQVTPHYPHYPDFDSGKKLYNSIIKDMMILDCQSHPNPTKFDLWKKSEFGNCPYANYKFTQLFNFTPKRDLFVGSKKALKTTVNLHKLINRVMKNNGNTLDWGGK